MDNTLMETNVDIDGLEASENSSGPTEPNNMSEPDTSASILDQTLDGLQKLEHKIGKNKEHIKKNRNLMNTILENQNKMFIALSEVNHSLLMVMDSLQTNTQNSVPKLPKLPLKKVEDLVLLNQQLSTQEFMCEMILHLRRSSSEQIYRTIKYCLERICSDCLLLRYSRFEMAARLRPRSIRIHQQLLTKFTNIMQLMCNVHNYLKTTNTVSIECINNNTRAFLKRARFQYRSKRSAVETSPSSSGVNSQLF